MGLEGWQEEEEEEESPGGEQGDEEHPARTCSTYTLIIGHSRFVLDLP